MPPFIGVRAISRSQNVRVGGQKLTETVTTYVDLDPASPNIPNAYPAVKELRSHLALGALIVVEPLTWTASDWAVKNGVVTTATAAGGKESTIATTAGAVTQRSTGAETLVETESKAYASTIAGKDRYDIITANESAVGKAKYLAGSAAATGKAVVPQTTEEVKLAEYATKLAKGEITDAEYKADVVALAKELLVATIFWSGVTETPVVVNLNRA
jgi:hypothetical protein